MAYANTRMLIALLLIVLAGCGSASAAPTPAPAESTPAGGGPRSLGDPHAPLKVVYYGDYQ